MPAPIVFAPGTIATTTAGLANPTSIGAGRDGRFIVAWNVADGTRGESVYEGPVIAPSGVVNTSTIASADTEPLILASGNSVSFYSYLNVTNRDIFFAIRIKQPDGSYTFAPGPITVFATAAGNETRPEAAALTNGGFVVAWADSTDQTIKFRPYSAAGFGLGTIGTVPVAASQVDNSKNFDLVGLADGGFAMTYVGTGSQAVKLTIVNSSGVITLNGADASAQATGSNHGIASVTQLTNGNIVAAWTDYDNNGVGYRIFTSAGVALTGDLLIPNVIAQSAFSAPRLAATLDGRFIVVSTDGLGTVSGQMVFADGTLDGGIFAVASAMQIGTQDVETTADGRIIVSYSDIAGVYASILDPRETGVTINGTSGRDNYVGSNFSDTLSGFDGNDVLSGSNGSDVLIGGAGNDTIAGGLDADQSFGGDGDDVIYAFAATAPNASTTGDTMDGGAGTDTLVGSTGDDVLIGGTGIDTMIGGPGNDSYVVENVLDVVTEDTASSAGNYDIVTATVNYTLSANIEQLVVQGGATAGTGNATANYLYGGNSGLSLTLNGAGGDDVIYASLAGGNTINGGSGVDTLLIYGGNNTVNGGLDSDIYYTYTATDTLSEAGGSGIDTVYATWNITLAAGFEQLLLSGAATTAVGSVDNNIIYGNSTSGAVTLFGLAGADVLFGGASSDTLNGGSENDQLFGLGGVNTLIGGTGNDIFYAETSGNVITEVAGEGFDTMYSNAAGIAQLANNVEQLILYGASTGGTGTSGGDYIYANGATSAMALSGGDGFDYILGSNQADTIIGGLGNDQIDLRGAGTAGNDFVKFNQVGNFGADTVFGFDSDATGGQDLIDISGMGYGAVSFGTTIIIQASGANTLVTFQGATNLAGTIVTLNGVSAATVTSADFLF